MSNDSTPAGAIVGDFDESGDVTFDVEPYDAGMVLFSVTIAGESYPVEITHMTALELSRRLSVAADDSVPVTIDEYLGRTS